LADSWKMSEDLDLEEVKTQIMDLQANLAFKKGELDKAIRLFQLVTQRLVFHQGYAATDNAVVEMSIKIAQMYAMKGKIMESLAGFEYCADTQVKKVWNYKNATFGLE
jgi:ACT domain-containing protein